MKNYFKILPFLVLSFTFFAGAQQIIAHRGASHDAPENTIPAFEQAWEQGAHYIEGDFLLTADNKIVCIHDKTTKKVADKNLTVSKTILEELQKLDVGSRKNKKFANTRIPLLTEVLATIPDGKGLFLEIKCGPEIVPHLKKELNNVDLKKKEIQIICFNVNTLKACQKQLPGIKLQWLKSYDKKKGKDFLTDFAAQAKAHGFDGIGTNVKPELIPENSREILKEAGLTLNIWTVNSADHAKKLLPHVDYITTDKPGLLIKASKTK